MSNSYMIDFLNWFFDSIQQFLIFKFHFLNNIYMWMMMMIVHTLLCKIIIIIYNKDIMNMTPNKKLDIGFFIWLLYMIVLVMKVIYKQIFKMKNLQKTLEILFMSFPMTIMAMNTIYSCMITYKLDIFFIIVLYVSMFFLFIYSLAIYYCNIYKIMESYEAMIWLKLSMLWLIFSLFFNSILKMQSLLFPLIICYPMLLVFGMGSLLTKKYPFTKKEFLNKIQLYTKQKLKLHMLQFLYWLIVEFFLIFWFFMFFYLFNTNMMMLIFANIICLVLILMYMGLMGIEMQNLTIKDLLMMNFLMVIYMFQFIFFWYYWYLFCIMIHILAIMM